MGIIEGPFRFIRSIETINPDVPPGKGDLCSRYWHMVGHQRAVFSTKYTGWQSRSVRLEPPSGNFQHRYITISKNYQSFMPGNALISSNPTAIAEIGNDTQYRGTVNYWGIFTHNQDTRVIGVTGPSNFVPYSLTVRFENTPSNLPVVVSTQALSNTPTYNNATGFNASAGFVYGEAQRDAGPEQYAGYGHYTEFPNGWEESFYEPDNAHAFSGVARQSTPLGYLEGQLVSTEGDSPSGSYGGYKTNHYETYIGPEEQAIYNGMALIFEASGFSNLRYLTMTVLVALPKHGEIPAGYNFHLNVNGNPNSQYVKSYNSGVVDASGVIYENLEITDWLSGGIPQAVKDIFPNLVDTGHATRLNMLTTDSGGIHGQVTLIRPEIRKKPSIGDVVFKTEVELWLVYQKVSNGSFESVWLGNIDIAAWSAKMAVNNRPELDRPVNLNFATLNNRHTYYLAERPEFVSSLSDSYDGNCSSAPITLTL
jgi:hypothetical protein